MEDAERQVRNAEIDFYWAGRTEAERWWLEDPRSIHSGEYAVFWDPFDPETNSRTLADFGRIFCNRLLGSYFEEIMKGGLLFEASKISHHLMDLAQQDSAVAEYLSSVEPGWFPKRLLGRWFDGWSDGVRSKWSDDVFPIFFTY